jgi:hypothetical protein
MPGLNPVAGESTSLISRNLQRNYGANDRAEEKKLEPAAMTVENLRAVWNVSEAEKNELIELALRNARVRHSEQIMRQLATIRRIAEKYAYLLGPESQQIVRDARSFSTFMRIDFNGLEQQLLSHHYSKLELCMLNPYTRVVKRSCFWASSCALMAAYFSSTGDATCLVGKPAYDALLGTGCGLIIAGGITGCNFMAQKWKAENLYYEYLQSAQASIIEDILKLKYAEVYLHSLAIDPESRLQEVCHAHLEHLKTLIEFTQRSFGQLEAPQNQVMQDGLKVGVPRMGIV